MAPLTLRRSWLVTRDPLSVVYLAIIYAVLTIALVAEWGRIVRVIAIDVSQNGSDVAAPYLSTVPGDLQ
jgi:hypothetical protein